MKSRIFHIATFTLLVAAAVFVFRGQLRDAWFEWQKPELPPAVAYGDIAPAPAPVNAPVTPPVTANAPAQTNNNANLPVPTPTPDPVPATPATTRPREFNLAVPFTTQAPFANWTGSYEDGCEEASALMVDHFYKKKTIPSQDYAKAELDKMFAWEDATFGYNLDTTAAETARMLREYYGYTRTRVDADVTVERIKELVAQGIPVIVPAYGKALLNPNFRNGGPDYHMLVIRGYTAESFITNDPGTRRGEAYVYPIDRLMAAIHDWNGGDVPNGQRVMIVPER